MTDRQRFRDALSHKQNEFTPWAVGFTLNSRKRLEAYFGDPMFDRRWNEFADIRDCLRGPQELPGQPEHFRDEFGVVWNRTGVDKDIGVIDRPLIADIEAADYTFPPVEEAYIRGQMERLTGERNGKFKQAALGFSVFERAWSLCGMENVLAAMITAPAALEALMEQICDYNLRVLDVVLEYAADLDAVYFGDDWGQQRGMIMGPALWRRFIAPTVARMYGRVKAAGLFVVQHSCGDIGEIFGDLIDLGLDCYQTFQPEIYDLPAVKVEYGDDLSFWGGISTQQLLATGTPQQVRDTTLWTLRVMGPGGGYIAGPTHAVPGDVPGENIEAMMEILTNQERYL